MSHKSKVARQLWIPGDGTMGFWVQPVIDGGTVLGSQASIALHDRRSSAVGKNIVVLWDERTERVGAIFFRASERCRCIDIPKNDAIHRCPGKQHNALQDLVIGAYTTMFDNEIALLCHLQEPGDFNGRLIDDHIRVSNVLGIPILLALKDVRLGECNLVTESRKALVHAPVIRGGAIPVRRSKTGTEGENPHFPSSSQISINCLARCAQVCFSRIVFRPCAAICSRARSSLRRCRISAAMARPSSTER